MRLFGFLRRAAPKPSKPEYKPIILNDKEQKIFERLKSISLVPEKKVVLKRENGDRQLEGEECFFMPGGKPICSLNELLNYTKTMNDGDFFWLILSRKEDINRWVIGMFGKSVLAEQLIQSGSKQEFIETLSHGILESVDIERDSDFYKMLDVLKYKLEDIKDDVKEARKQGVNTFVPQTKLMNIKSKIDFAEVKQDKDELAKISARLDEILADLELEKKGGENARAET